MRPNRSPSRAARPVPRRWASRSQAAVSSAARAKGLPADAVLEERVDLLGAAHLTIDEARDEDLLEQVARGAERLLGVERQLERRRFAVADVAGLVMEHDDQRAADGHRAAGDDERLAQREGELVELDAGQAHHSSLAHRSRNRSSPAAPVQHARPLQLQHPGHEAVDGMKEQRVERALGAGAGGGGKLTERQLEVRVQRDAFAAGARVVEDQDRTAIARRGATRSRKRS